MATEGRATGVSYVRGAGWVLVGITLLAAALRLVRLDHGGLWYDELIMARITHGPWSALWAEVMVGRPPMYPVIGKLWALCFGDSDTALRSLSAVLGVVSVPLMFFVARRLFDVRVGLVAAALLAVSPYQIYYSQEHRYYVMLLVFCLASMVWLLRALGVGDPSSVAKATAPRGARSLHADPVRTGDWLGYIVASTLAFYCHTFFLFLLVSIGGAVLIMYARGSVSPARMRRFLLSQVVIMGLILPWGLLKMSLMQSAVLGADGESGALVVPWITSPPWWAPVRTVGNFLFLGMKYLSVYWVLGGVLVLLVGCVVGGRRRGGWRPWSAGLGRSVATVWSGRRGGWWIAGAWALGPLVTVWLLSYAVRPIYNDRYLMASSAGVMLLLAAGMVAVSRLLPVWASLGVVLLGMAGSLSQYYENPEKGAWAEAAAWLDANREADEALVFTSERGIGRESTNVRNNWFWYARRGAEEESAEVQVRSSFNDTVRALKSAAQPDAGVWLVMWRDPHDPLGLEQSFADGPVDGLALSEVKKFFDLTLMRFERDPNDAALAESRGPFDSTQTPNQTMED